MSKIIVLAKKVSRLLLVFLLLMAFLKPFKLKAAGNFYVRNYGAVGDGQTNDKDAIQSAIDAASSAGGGDVIFDAGRTYYTGNLFMKSTVNLVIEAGSTIQASNWYADYDPQDCDNDNVCDNVAPLISANNVSNVGIEGGGRIRGIRDISNGNFYCPGHVVCDWDSGGASYGPSLVFWGDVSHGTIRNVRIEECDNATLAIAESDNVLIENIYLHSNINTLNNDTLNIYGSQYVTLRGNVIESGDDAICLKMRGPYNGVTMTTFNSEDMHDITIENNTVYAPFGGGGLVVGHWEVYFGEVYNVWFRNNTIRTGTQVPLLFKDRDVGETTHLHDIYFENNKWDTGVLAPLFSLWTPTYQCQRWNIFFNGQDLHLTMPGQVDSAEDCGGTSCSCSSWQDQSCGGGSCIASQMYQTRTCTPASCSTERCTSHVSCGPTSTPVPSPTPTIAGPTSTPTPTLAPLPGDLDNDWDVDIDDYNILLFEFAYSGCGNIADIDEDCVVGIYDYNILVENYGIVPTPTPTYRPTLTPTPTPSGPIHCSECHNDILCSTPCWYYENTLTCGEVWKGWWGNECVE